MPHLCPECDRPCYCTQGEAKREQCDHCAEGEDWGDETDAPEYDDDEDIEDFI